MGTGEKRNHLLSGKSGERGFTLTEFLVVLAVMGLFIVFAGPAFNESFRAYKVRSSSQELADVLRAVRQVAVSTQNASSLVVDVSGRSYTWNDFKGKSRTIQLPDPVRFQTANPATITFISDGTVSTGSATIALENIITSSRADRWTLSLNTIGRVDMAYSHVTP